MADVGISVAMRGMDSVTRGFGKLGGDARKLGTDAQGASRGVDALSNSMRRMQQAVLGVGLFQLAKGAVEATLAFQRMERTLTVATGSTHGAARAMAFARSEADRLGLNLRDTAGGFARMMVAAKGTSLEGENAKRIFTGVAEASAVMGLTADETAGAFKAIEQMISKGNVSAEELRGQLGERLPGAFQIMARAMGVTTVQLNKMLEQGQVQAAEVLPKFAEELRKTFGDGVSKAATSAQAAINRFGTAWDDVQVAFANSGFLDGVVVAMQDLAKASKDPEFLSSLQAIGRALGNIISLTGDLIDFTGKSIQGWEMMGKAVSDFSGLTYLDQQVSGGGEADKPDYKPKGRGASMSRAWEGRIGQFQADREKNAVKAEAESKSALRARVKADEEAIELAQDNADRMRELDEQMWQRTADMIDKARTPLDDYNESLQELQIVYSRLPGGAEQYNDILKKINIELAESNKTVGAFESAFDGIFDAAIEGGADFMDTLEDIGKQLAKDLIKGNLYDPLKDMAKGAIGGLLGGGAGMKEGEGGGTTDPMAMVFNEFLGGMGELLGGGEKGFLGNLSKLFLGDEGLLGQLGGIFSGAWEQLTALFAWFIGEETALAIFETAERWAIAIWETVELWAIAIFNAAMSLFGLETGGDVTVTRPTLIMVGEKNKAERVRVSPLGGPPRASTQQQVNRMMAQNESQNMLQPNVNVYLPASSVINDLTAGHFARQISGAVRRVDARRV